MNRARILCVEDNAQFRGTLKTALELNGLEVITASNGVDALKQYATHFGDFSVILTDNEMPQMNGLEFVRSVREIGFKNRIFVMSGNLDAKGVMAYQQHVISGFFYKPFDIKLLAKMLL